MRVRGSSHRANLSTATTRPVGQPVACQPLTFGYGDNLEGFLLRNLEVATSAGLRDDRWSLRLAWQRWNSNSYRSTEDG